MDFIRKLPPHMQEGRRHSMDRALSSVENHGVHGYFTHWQLRRLCCNLATRSSLEHRCDIVSCPEEEEAAVGGRRMRERERQRSRATLRRVLGRVTSWLRNASLPDALSVELKTYPSSRPVAARAQWHSLSRR